MAKTPRHHQAKHCHLCGRRLRGRGWIYTPNGASEDQSLVICRDCHENAPRCETCGMPMGETYTHLPDGRRICARCSRTVILDAAQAHTHFERVVRVVTEQLGLSLNVGAEFALVDPHHLRRLAEEARQETHSDPENVVGLFIRRGHKRVMYVLSGLPRAALIHTIAHEWAHAWQGENCPLLKDPLVREGFAEWIAHKTLQALGETSTEPSKGLYREGLQTMLRLEQDHGFSGVLAFCRRAE